MKFVNVRRFEEYDDVDIDIIKKIIRKEKWNEIECLVVYDDEDMKLIYFYFENELKPIKYNDDKFDYVNLQNGTHRILYKELQNYIDIDELVVMYCKNGEETKVKKYIDNYKDNIDLKRNCEIYGRNHGKSIIFDDSFIFHNQKYGEKEPIKGRRWEKIPFSQIILPGEIDGLLIDTSYDIEVLLDFFEHELKKKHYPYLGNYNYDLVQPHILKKLLKRAKINHFRFYGLEELLKKLDDAGIKEIESNPFFRNELYPILYE